MANLVGVLGDHLVVRVGHIRALHHERLVVERGGSHLFLSSLCFGLELESADGDRRTEKQGMTRRWVVGESNITHNRTRYRTILWGRINSVGLVGTMP